MQVLQCASSKNSYLFQIQLILLNIPNRAYIFKKKKKKNPQKLKHFYLEKKNMLCLCYLPIPHNRHSLSGGHQTVTMIMNSCCYCFNGLWKVKVKYIVLCSNAFAKLQNARGTSRHPVLMDNGELPYL